MTTTPYLLGRLLAALVDQEALKPERWQGNPKTLLLGIRAAKSKDAIAPIMEALPVDALNGNGMSPEDESDFWLGYYHQRAELRNGGRISANRPEPEVELKTRFEVRLDDDLKTWTMANGGSDLVRALLRDERARRN